MMEEGRGGQCRVEVGEVLPFVQATPLTPKLKVAVGVAVGEGVAEHEPGIERPVAVHPQVHGNGAADASGQ